MLVENQFFNVKWNKKTREWYESKGYKFTKTGDIFCVKAEDLSLGSKQKVKVKCDYCGRIIDVVYKDYVNYNYDKYACSHCKGIKASENTLGQRQQYLYNKIKSVCDEFGYTLLTNKEDILNSESRVDYLCPKHGLHNTKAYTLFLGHGCNDCAIENRDWNKNKPEDVIKLGEKLDINILNPNEYVDYYTENLQCVCNKCKNIYITSYQMLKQGRCLICPMCTKSESHGETKIRLYLENHNILFEQQKRFNDCRTRVPLPFDFYLPDLNTIIEYDGEGHYQVIDFNGHNGEETFKSTTKNDKIKNKYCNDNNINLIRIPYWEFNNIEKILDEKLFTQRYSLVS